MGQNKGVKKSKIKSIITDVVKYMTKVNYTILIENVPVTKNV